MQKEPLIIWLGSRVHVDMLAGLLCLSRLRLGMVARLSPTQNLVLCPQGVDRGLVLVGVLVAADAIAQPRTQVRLMAGRVGGLGEITTRGVCCRRVGCLVSGNGSSCVAKGVCVCLEV